MISSFADVNTKSLCAKLTATVSTNQTVIAAVTGKIHRIIGAVISPGAGASVQTYKSNNSTALFELTAPSHTVTLPTILPIVASGYFETVVGESLTVDVSTTAASINIFYITYTP